MTPTERTDVVIENGVMRRFLEERGSCGYCVKVKECGLQEYTGPCPPVGDRIAAAVKEEKEAQHVDTD